MMHLLYRSILFSVYCSYVTELIYFCRTYFLFKNIFTDNDALQENQML